MIPDLVYINLSNAVLTVAVAVFIYAIGKAISLVLCVNNKRK